MSSVQDVHGGGPNSESRLNFEGPENRRTISTENRRRRYLRSRLHASMYQAAFEGDWQAAQIVLQMDKNVVREKITERGDTALHVAVMTKQTNFVKKLVKEMDRADLSIENAFGYAAFIYAAASGIVKIADVMREKMPDLVTHYGKYDRKPIQWAALFGHADMVSYLYKFTRSQDLSTEEWFALLLATIEKRMYDVALKIFESQKNLAIMIVRAAAAEEEAAGRQALRLLAEHDMSNISTCQEAFLRSLVRMYAAIPRLSWFRSIYEQPLMRKRAWLLAQKMWNEIQGVEDATLFDKLINDPPILHDAAKVGNLEFIVMLTGCDPDLMFRSDSDELMCTLFHIAVSHRQENVFRLFDKIGAMKDWIAIGKCDEEGNTLLHLAGKLAPPNRLKIVAGPALQMQRELIWFKELEKIVPSSCRRALNKDRLTPRKLFSKEHEQLLIYGETWIRETANYCMVTAALIATMVFAASITVPGGNNGEKGSPILLKRSFFRVFVVTDVAAMFFSTLSIIMFLSIQTSRFQEEDFLALIPAKLIVGLTALFFSIVSAMGAFTSTCFLLFTNQSAWISISVSALLCFLLVVIFVILHIKLWIDGIRLTYRATFLLGPSNRENFL